MNREQFKKLRRAWRVTSNYRYDEGPDPVPEKLKDFAKFHYYNYGLYDLKFLWSRAVDHKRPECWPRGIVDTQAIHDTIRRCMRSNAMRARGEVNHGYPCYWQRDEELTR